MQKITRRPGFNFTQAGFTSFLTLVNHQLVFPNETIQRHSVNLRLQSAPVKHVLGGAYLDTFTFMVPLRLLWDGWEDWITEGAGTLPRASVRNRFFMEENGDPSWPSLGMSHVFAEFFQSPFVTPAVSYQLPAVNSAADQAIFDASLFPEPEKLTLEVQSGAPDYVELPISELWEAEYRERMRNKLGSYQRPYQELLESYGVNVQREFGFAEYLGGSRRWVYPSRTIDPSTGFPVQGYMLDAKVQRDRKRIYAAEHAILLDFVALRPKVYFSDKARNSEGLREEPGDYMLPVRAADHLFRRDASSLYGVAGEMDLRSPLFSGEQRIGYGVEAGPGPDDPYVPVATVGGSASALFYPYCDPVASSDIVGGNHFVVDGRVSTDIRTWIGKPARPALAMDE